MRVAIDTSVATLIVAPRPPEGQEQQWNDARDLLRRKDLKLLLPAPALGELLLRFPAEKRAGVVELFDGMMKIIPYDHRAALLLSQTMLGADRLKALARQHRINKECVKVDWEIACCAARAGAALCSLDQGQRRFFDEVAGVGELADGVKSGAPEAFIHETNRSLPLEAGEHRMTRAEAIRRLIPRGMETWEEPDGDAGEHGETASGSGGLE